MRYAENWDTGCKQEHDVVRVVEQVQDCPGVEALGQLAEAAAG